MLVDRLEAVINGGTRVPMSNRVVVDEREALDVLDLMRTTIPDEIKQSRRTIQEREKILAQAQTEANRVVAQAQERAQRLLADDHVHIMAEEKAHDIVSTARQEADDVRRGADDYALDVLERLEAELQRVQGTVHNAINALSAQPPPLPMDEEEE